MKGKFSRLTLLLILVAMVATSLIVPMQAFGATTSTGYTRAEDVQYVTSGQYIYNWGARGETATFLSKYAQSFYTGNYTFANLSKVNGGSSQSNAPSSALYQQLKELMSSKQTYVTSYNATRPLYQYTDCQLSGKETKQISSFYSGDLIGPAWDSGNTWNREHVWPNSKGDASGQGENDIMMLRPTAKSENGSRGNKAYGESGSFYHPNSESGGKYDLRGDVARICLFVYTRWGNTGSMWGSSGVMESLTVLLKWMEEDPVDTWEMGRNDAVQAITGTRNAFVDYPEYAFLLFGEAVPANYVTPSQSNGVTPPNPDDCTHSFRQATCTQPQTCTLCHTTVGSALGHTAPDANGLCTRCGEVLELKTTHAGTKADPYSIADAIKVGKSLNGSDGTSIVYVKGQVVSIAENTGSYLKGIVIKDSSTTQTLSIYSADPQSSSDLNAKVGDTIVLYGYLRTASSGNIEMGTVNNTYVKFFISSSTPTHTHSFGQATCTKPATCSCGATQGNPLGHNEVIDSAVAPTCTTAGKTQGKHCSRCNAVLQAQTTVPATGHTQPNAEGKCDTCDAQLVDMQLAINNFKSAVASVQASVTLQTKFDAIKVALNAYNALNDGQKAQVTTEFATLKTQIESYNAEISKQNANSSNALTIVGLSIVAVAAAALMFFKKAF